jgi:hypothetical protein
MSGWDRGNQRQGRAPEAQDGSTDDAGGSHLSPSVRAALQRRKVQRKAERDARAKAQVPGGSGSPLAADVRTRMEGQLGVSLAGVRIHTGADSAKAASDFAAKAFAVGSDIHFGRGEYAPGTKDGDRLLAHELAHTVQSDSAGVHRKVDPSEADADAGPEVSDPNDREELEADAVADQAVDGLHGNHHGGLAAFRSAGAGPQPSAKGSKLARKIQRAPDPAAPQAGNTQPGGGAGTQQQAPQQQQQPGGDAQPQKSAEEQAAESAAQLIETALADATWGNLGGLVKLNTIVQLQEAALGGAPQNEKVVAVKAALAQKKAELVGAATERLNNFKGQVAALNNPQGATTKLSELKSNPEFKLLFDLPELPTMPELKAICRQAEQAWQQKTDELVYNHPMSDLNYDMNRGMDVAGTGGGTTMPAGNAQGNTPAQQQTTQQPQQTPQPQTEPASPEDAERQRLEQRKLEVEALIAGMVAEVKKKWTIADSAVSGGMTVLGVAASALMHMPLVGALAGVGSWISSRVFGKKKTKAEEKGQAVMEMLEMIDDPNVLEEILMAAAEDDMDLDGVKAAIEQELQKQGKGAQTGAEAGGHGAGHHGGLAHAVHVGEEAAHVAHTGLEAASGLSHTLPHVLHSILPPLGIVINGVKQTLNLGELRSLKPLIAEKKRLLDEIKAKGLPAIHPQVTGAAPPAGGGHH